MSRRTDATVVISIDGPYELVVAARERIEMAVRSIRLSAGFAELTVTCEVDGVERGLDR